MKKKGMQNFLMLLALAFFMLPALETSAQVSTSTGQTRSQTVRLQKDVPIRKLPPIKGKGTPTPLYVVQLSRFETMIEIPPEFPKGTFIYASPDHVNEKFLFAGYYSSFEEAKAAAKTFRKKRMFREAFARPKPLVIRYD
jgi:hypothetical protein